MKVKDGESVEMCSNLVINEDRLEWHYLGESIEDKIANVLTHFLKILKL